MEYCRSLHKPEPADNTIIPPFDFVFEVLINGFTYGVKVFICSTSDKKFLTIDWVLLFYHLLQIFLYFNFRGRTSPPPCGSAVFVLKRCVIQPPFCRPEEIFRWGRTNIFILLILGSLCVSNCVIIFHVYKCTCTLCTQYTLSFSLFLCFILLRNIYIDF